MRNRARGSLTRSDRHSRPACHTHTHIHTGHTPSRTHTGVQRPRGHMTTHTVHPTPDTLTDRHTWEIQAHTRPPADQAGHLQTLMPRAPPGHTASFLSPTPPWSLGYLAPAGTRALEGNVPAVGWGDQDSSRSLLSSSQCLDWGSAAEGLCSPPLAPVALDRTPVFRHLGARGLGQPRCQLSVLGVWGRVAGVREEQFCVGCYQAQCWVNVALGHPSSSSFPPSLLQPVLSLLPSVVPVLAPGRPIPAPRPGFGDSRGISAQAYYHPPPPKPPPPPLFWSLNVGSPQEGLCLMGLRSERPRITGL